MYIDKKLLLLFLLLLSYNFTIAQSYPERAYENQEIRLRNSVEIFPNPTTDYLNIKIKQAELSSIGFEMYNIIGNVIKIEYEKVDNSTYKIPVKELTNGYYVLIIKDEETKFRKALKFLKI